MSAIFKLSYGLFVLSANKDGKDNGCIINTAMQVTDTPLQMSICVNKANYTTEMIMDTGEFNVSILNQDVKFDIFKRFGFQSGRNNDKYADFNSVERADNGIYYLTEGANSFLSGKVTKTFDLGTHNMFIAEVTDEKILNDIPSVTYQYYFDHIKPKPQPKEEKKKGYVCKICGYVYEGDTLPEDFVCPICKHGAADFEPL